MQYLAILICAIICLFSWRKEKNFYNPITVMSGLWTIITILASLRLYGLYEADSRVYLLVAVGIAAFSLGCLVNRKTKLAINTTPKQRGDGETRESDIGNVRMTVLHVLCVLSVIMMIYPDYLAIRSLLMSGGDMSLIREDFGIVYSNIVLRLIYNYIVLPFSFAAGPIFASALFLGKRTDKLVIFSVGFIVFSRLLTEAGRFIVLYFLLSILVAYRITKPKTTQKSKVFTKKKIGVALLVAICICAVMVVTRSRTDQTLLEHGYTYLCGCIPHLSVRLKEVDARGTLTYGTASVFGYVEFLFTMLENIGFPYPAFAREASRAVSVVRYQVTMCSLTLLFRRFIICLVTEGYGA